MVVGKIFGYRLSTTYPTISAGEHDAGRSQRVAHSFSPGATARVMPLVGNCPESVPVPLRGYPLSVKDGSFQGVLVLHDFI